MANNKKKKGKNEDEAMVQHSAGIALFSSVALPASAKDAGEIYAQRLRKRLEERGMTQKQLADSSGLTAQAISKILNNGVSQVDLMRARLFAAILSCSPHYLLGLTDEPNAVPAPSGESEEFYPILPIPRTEVLFAECMKKCTDLEFVKCICEILAKDSPENTYVQRAKTMLKSAGFCDPDKFPLILPGDFPQQYVEDAKVEPPGDKSGNLEHTTAES